MGNKELQARAERVFQEFKELRERGEKVSIEEYCERFPPLADALHCLHSLMVEISIHQQPTIAGLSPGDHLTPTQDIPSQSPIEEILRSSDRFTCQGYGPGMAIGRYRLISKMGEGGFGAVFLAEQTEPVKRQVALKLLRVGAASQEVIVRFKMECQALALMNHPHIAKVHDAGVTPQGQPYFVMEHIRGEPLDAFCDRKRFNLQERLRLLARVCEAIQHAHLKGIIHRDLKPSNILVEEGENSAGIPKVIDFGLAKALNEPLTHEPLATQMGQLMGTPDYMSPEQALGNPAEIDARTDIYSLGVILYQLLAG